VTGTHPDVGPELRRLARSILDGIDPALRAVATMAAAGDPGKCQQVWCPVCALAAVINGEHHPLLEVIGEHSVALLTVIRALIDNADAGTDTPPPDGPPGGGSDAPRRGYEHIPVSVEE